MKIRQISGMLLLSGTLMTTTVHAEQIVLKDGSRIQGDVVSMQNGSYTIRTNSMGTITLRQNQIQSISSGGAAPSSNESLADKLQQKASESAASGIQSLQSSMVSNENVMSMIMNLQNNPDMQAVLQDPEVMRMVQNFDLQGLSKHPKMIKLMKNSDVKRIQGEVR